LFNTDPYPGRPRILFVGIPYSTHTHSWIDLLRGEEFNPRLFALPEGVPPDTFDVPTYVTARDLPRGMDGANRLTLWPTPEEWDAYQSGVAALQADNARAMEIVHRLMQKSPSHFSWAFLSLMLRREVKKSNLDPDEIPRFLTDFHPVLKVLKTCDPPERRAESPEAWLAQVISDWKPHIIHTLGLDPASSFYFKVRQGLECKGSAKWLVQLRGGSDLALTRFNPHMREHIAQILGECDQLISDNPMNFEYAAAFGVDKKKFATIAPVPGTGGIEVQKLSDSWQGLPSSRRIIVWPKSYECPWSKSLPVLDAIRLAWKDIEPCSIHMLTMNEESLMWYYTLEEEIRKSCTIYQGIPRQEVLDLMTRARVMLAPSLIDGVPNSLYEAMAAGAFPIVSPLDTIVPLVTDGVNVLFARNLNSQEIATALVRAMNDDALVDTCAVRNLELVREIANRVDIRKRVIGYYRTMANQSA
jgi:hypothetical protein